MSDITRGILEFVCEEHGCALEYNVDPSGRITPLKAIADSGPYMFDLRNNSGLICPTNWQQTEERGGDEAPDFEDFFGSCKPKWRVRLSEIFAVANA